MDFSNNETSSSSAFSNTISNNSDTNDNSENNTGEHAIEATKSIDLEKPLKPGQQQQQQFYYLPHWSSIMMTPSSTSSVGLLRRSSIDESCKTSSADASTSPSTLTNSAIPILGDLFLRDQEKFCRDNTKTPPELDLNTPVATPLKMSLITTPTSFNNNFLFNASPAAKNNCDDSLCPSAFTVSQSPKVLVSNHQLVVDLCTYATSNLKLAELSSSSINDNNNNNENSCGECEATGSNKRKLCSSSFSSSGNNSLNLNELISIDSGIDNSIEAKEEKSSARATTDADSSGVASLSARPPLSKRFLLDNELDSKKVEITSAEGDQESQCEEIKEEIATKTLDSNSIATLSVCIDRLPINITALKNVHRFPRTNFPLSSSPAPIRKSGSSFDFDKSLKHPKSIKT